MDVPSHAEVVAQIDAFLSRHQMAPSRLGRDALGEPQFVSSLRAGRLPGLPTLQKLSRFMRQRDEQLSIGEHDGGVGLGRHRLSAGRR